MVKAFRVSAASANILYRDIPGAGTPLVFIHGLGSPSSRDFPRIVTDPMLLGRRAILVDLLGSGFSDRPAGFSYAVDAHARAVAELVRHVCSGPVSLYGHSMGGAIAIVLATILGTRIEKLALSEPNLGPGGGLSSGKIAATTEADYVSRGHAALIETARREGNVAWAACLARSAAFAIHREATSLVAGSQPSWREMLCGLKFPRTVIFGERSLPNDDYDQLPRHGVGVDIVRKAGHAMQWDNPAGLATALSRALS